VPKAKPEPVNAPTAEDGDDGPPADPEMSAEAESETAADAKLESPAEDTGSADELPDAEEARGASKTQAEDIPQSGEDEPQQPQKSVAKPGVKKMASEAPKRTASAQSKSSSLKALTTKPTQPKGDDGAVDEESIVQNLQANATADDKVDRDAIAENLRANARNPAAKQQQKKAVKRSLSSDRGQERPAKASGVPLDRAAIRSALTGKPAPNSERRPRKKPNKRAS